MSMCKSSDVMLQLNKSFSFKSRSADCVCEKVQTPFAGWDGFLSPVVDTCMAVTKLAGHFVE